MSTVRRAASSRAWLSLVTALRMLTLILGLQVSGTAHSVADALSLVTDSHGEHEQCPADGACNDCLPGCPQCHCPNALRSLAAEPSLLSLALQNAKAELPKVTARVPSSPDLPGLFRPPQTDLVTS